MKERNGDKGRDKAEKSGEMESERKEDTSIKDLRNSVEH